MKYRYIHYDKEGDIDAYVFQCPNCKAYDNVTPLEMVKEQHDTK